MEVDTALVAAFLASQALQTVQLLLMGRSVNKVSRTLIPPAPAAMYPPPQAPQAAMYPFCFHCGNLTNPAELRGGLCADCVGKSPTEPPPVPIRRRRQ